MTVLLLDIGKIVQVQAPLGVIGLATIILRIITPSRKYNIFALIN